MFRFSTAYPQSPAAYSTRARRVNHLAAAQVDPEMGHVAVGNQVTRLESVHRYRPDRVHLRSVEAPVRKDGEGADGAAIALQRNDDPLAFFCEKRGERAVITIVVSDAVSEEQRPDLFTILDESAALAAEGILVACGTGAE